MLGEARNIMAQVRKLEKFIVQDLMENAQVITCTLVGAANELLRKSEFSTVFIDEAAQALESATWIPIQRAGRVIFAGDHCQLPPTVKSVEAEKKGFNISLFEKCIQRQAQTATLLNIQYRMNEKIMEFSSQEFYQL